MARMRLGVVLLVPPPVDREVDALRKGLGDGSLGRIPAHVTLVPPVNVRQDHLDDALRVLREAGAETGPFTASLGPPTSFLPDNPVLYLPVEAGAEEVTRLRQRVFREPLARAVSWPYVPHLTVADEADPGRIAAARVALADYRTEITFDRVHLLREGPGREWAPIADAALARPAVVGRGGLPVELSLTAALDAEARAFFEREWPLHVAHEMGAGRPWRGEPFVVTARDGGVVVGTAEGWTYGDVGHLERLIVAAGERGRGIGSHLLASVQSLAVERGCRQLVVRALAASAAARFYRRRGWYDDVRLTAWAFDCDFVLLRRDL